MAWRKETFHGYANCPDMLKIAAHHGTTDEAIHGLFCGNYGNRELTTMSALSLRVNEITVKSNSIWRRLAALISGAEDNNGLYRACRSTTAAQGVVKVIDPLFASFCHFAEDVYAGSDSDAAKE